ncbi:uncharacterized protein FIBRA_05264 [Fibroporia radiculosa]|uniref:Homeobox KN domain-containing protein n=1 Tax=Fibroporia radiculosa TaxID=599839 RepID=J4HX81_9APHY|nr:uncharacterized protein FIBRA_05264 [Fibroporia radiculosa]CCM03142.1 predicted protein [Fibroporia radiculosa]
MEGIRQRLSQIEDDFFAALTDGPVALEVFGEEWSSLSRDLDAVLASDSNIDSDLVAVAYAAASRIEILAQASYDLHVDYQALTIDVTDEMAQLSLDDEPVVASSSPSCHDEPNDAMQAKIVAYSWLAVNLHNPYPSVAARQTIARSAGVSMRQVSGWLKTLRKSIGWTALCRKRFRGSRKKIVSAASRAFYRTSLSDSLSPDLLFEFKAIRSKVLRFIDEASNLHYPEDEHSSEYGIGETCADDVREDKAILSSAACHPQQVSIPSLSITSSPMEDPVVDEYAVRRTTTHKRSASALLEADAISNKEPITMPSASAPQGDFVSTNSHAIERAVKRQRSDHNLLVSSIPTGAIDYHVNYASCLSQTQATTASPLGSDLLRSPSRSGSSVRPRKRHLSSLDHAPAPKRSKGVQGARSVSDPLPMSAAELEEQTYNINDWYGVVFNVPGPVSLATPDSTTPLEIKVFDNWAPWVISQTQRNDDSTKPPDANADLLANAKASDFISSSLNITSTPEAIVRANNFAQETSVIDNHLLSWSDDMKPTSAIESCYTDSIASTRPLMASRACGRDELALPAAPSSVCSDLMGLSGEFKVVQLDAMKIHTNLCNRDAHSSQDNALRYNVEPCSDSPPPPFIELNDLSPPSYTLLDQFAEPGFTIPPPPYCSSPEKKGPSQDLEGLDSELGHPAMWITSMPKYAFSVEGWGSDIASTIEQTNLQTICRLD